MEAHEIIEYIKHTKKHTPVKVYVKSNKKLHVSKAQVFGVEDQVIIGDYEDIKPILKQYEEDIRDIYIEQGCRNSAIPLLDILDLNARIEPGAILREQVEIGKQAIIMMGAILNIGAVVGDYSMIDMGAILGGRAIVGKRCHVGAGAVLAGVIEPPSATPVMIEDDVMIGANAVVIEGIRIGKGAIVAAGAIVIEDVPENAVVAGCPARIVKMKDNRSSKKTEIIDSLRQL